MNSVKQEVIELIQELPDDCTFEDIRYRLHLQRLLMEGEQDLRDGNVMDTDELRRRMVEWRKSVGRGER